MTARTLVIGTAGHIDHGKTTLLRALTGIDADRLPEERRRGMTIDVGYAHLELPDGTSLDFVDVPGHDKLIGNMLVGAGEVDAALLVVAADDGPRAQTLEHLELLDALGIGRAVGVVTKIDAVDADRVASVIEQVRSLMGRTSMAGAAVLAASGQSGEGIEELRAALLGLRERAKPGEAAAASRLAIDRVFRVRGRGTVVTGSLRGAPIWPGMTLRLLPDEVDVRVREVQVHGRAVERAMAGRTAVLLAGIDTDRLHRGQVLLHGDGPVATSRILVALRPGTPLSPGAPRDAPPNGARLQLHLGTEHVGALVVRSPRETAELPDEAAIAILRLDRPIAAAAHDRFVLRDPGGSGSPHGGVVLDPVPPRGVSRRRATPERLRSLAAVVTTGGDITPARLALHGRVDADLAPDVAVAVEAVALGVVHRRHEAQPESLGIAMTVVRGEISGALRRLVTISRDDADRIAGSTLESVVRKGRLARDGDRLRDPTRAAGLPRDVRAAMDRLEAVLSTPSPPGLSEAARAAGCPPDGIRALIDEGRIVRLADDMAWSATTYKELARTAVTMAATGPLTPAAFRDATHSSRKFVMAILEDLDRRELLRRTDAGHVLGRKSLAKARPAEPATPATG